MSVTKKLVVNFRIWRARYWRAKRLLFPSPAELRFIELMGGKVWRIQRLKAHDTGFCFSIVVSLGRWLRAENFKREVRLGRYFVDFANDINRVIEIDGAAYHMDVVADFDRDIYLQDKPFYCRIVRVPAYRIYNNPTKVQQDIVTFLTK